MKRIFSLTVHPGDLALKRYVDGDAGDGEREHPQLRLVMVGDLIDGAAGQPRDGDRAHHRERREQEGPEDAPLVWAQESEQADERAPIRNGAHPRNLAATRCSTARGLRELRELRANECCSARGELSVRRRVQPAARARGVRKRNDDRAGAVVPVADALPKATDAQQTADRQAPDGDDQTRPHDLQLPITPKRA
jgi:hypothetical protein